MRNDALILALLIAAYAPPVAAQTNEAPVSQPAPKPEKEPVDLTGTVMASPPVTPSPPPASPPSGARPAECPQRWIREGFYLRMFTGMSYLSATGHGPRGSASISGMGSNSIIGIGGTILRGLVLAGTMQSAATSGTFKGGPFAGATITTDGSPIAASVKATAAVSQLGLLVDFYPEPALGWHAGLSGGLGLAAVVNQADDSTMAGTSLGGTLFGGYDFSIGPSWSMGISLFGSGFTSADMKKTDGGSAGYKLKSFSVGLAGSILYF